MSHTLSDRQFFFFQVSATPRELASAKARVVLVPPEGIGPVGLGCRAAPQLEGRRAAEVAQVLAEALREGEGELVEALRVVSTYVSK